MNLSKYDKIIISYKTYISDFYIGDLRWDHFCDLPIIGQWAKNQLRYIYILSRKYICVESYRIGQLLTIQVKICIFCSSKGHLRSPEATNRQLPITFDKKQRRGIDVRTFVSARRIDWYALWPISVTKWPWPNLKRGQTLTLTFHGHFVYGSTRLNETNMMVSESLIYL